jgi:predicted  nucleic acid-binding Zn-ribbon protein
MTAWTLKDVQDEINAQSGRIATAEDEIVDLNDFIVQLENDIADL